jgi:LmbE family N-acetylglucosaminyl deacetylase
MNVLGIIAHPDDEALGLGGTLAKHSKNGDKVFLCVLSNHAAARKLRPEQETFNDQLARSAQTLGILDIKQFDYPNIRMNTVPTLELVQAIESAIIQFTRKLYTRITGEI